MMGGRMPATASYSFNSSRYARAIGLLGVFAIFMVPATVFLPNVPPAQRVVMAAGTIAILLLLALSVPRLFNRKPILVVSDDGVTLPRFAKERLDWTHVTEIRRLTIGRSDLLTFTVDPETAKNLTRPAPARFFGPRRTMSVPLSLLNGPRDEIAADCDRRWRAARRVAPSSTPSAVSESSAALTLNRPWLTYALLVVLGAVYVGELAFAVSPGKVGSPSILTLAYLGGNVGNRIWQYGEWWRLFTAPLLHGSPIHLLLNGFVLWIAGTALEKLVGWRWLGAIFALSALGGSFGSLAFNAPNVVGVGASGGIMGLLAALFVMSWHLPAGMSRLQPQVRSAQMIVPALLPGFSSGSTGLTIDYAAHGGGVIVGALVAMALLRLWPRDRNAPPFALAAACVAGAYLAVAVGSVAPIARFYGKS